MLPWLAKVSLFQATVRIFQLLMSRGHLQKTLPITNRMSLALDLYERSAIDNTKTAAAYKFAEAM